MYQTILFDLDGTLTNSELGITNSAAYALGKYGIQVPDKKALRVFIGPPLQESFERFYGFSKEECLKAIDYYHEYFSEKGLYENEVYLGVPDLLASLKQAGKQLIVDTSKPEEFSIQILKHFGLYDYFDFVAGATMDRKRSKNYFFFHSLVSFDFNYDYYTTLHTSGAGKIRKSPPATKSTGGLVE